VISLDTPVFQVSRELQDAWLHEKKNFQQTMVSSTVQPVAYGNGCDFCGSIVVVRPSLMILQE